MWQILCICEFINVLTKLVITLLTSIEKWYFKNFVCNIVAIIGNPDDLLVANKINTNVWNMLRFTLSDYVIHFYQVTDRHKYFHLRKLQNKENNTTKKYGNNWKKQKKKKTNWKMKSKSNFIVYGFSKERQQLIKKRVWFYYSCGG